MHMFHFHAYDRNTLTSLQSMQKTAQYEHVDKSTSCGRHIVLARRYSNETNLHKYLCSKKQNRLTKALTDILDNNISNLLTKNYVL